MTEFVDASSLLRCVTACAKHARLPAADRIVVAVVNDSLMD